MFGTTLLILGATVLAAGLPPPPLPPLPAEALRFNPDLQNNYHLFTRNNPTVSHPLLLGSDSLLGASNFSPQRRTIILVHGWLDTVTGDFNAVLVPAFLAAEDVNVIVVDWGAGSGTINYYAAVANTVISGEGVARFINWLNQVTGASPNNYHIVGHSLGGHQAGVVGRNVNGQIAYITSLDPAGPGWLLNDDKFHENDAAYTEVIHTNSGLLGYLGALGHADFYPNNGVTMPGCDSQSCDHDRCFFYLAESVRSGGFSSQRCATVTGALAGSCLLGAGPTMGGLVPKTGTRGIFHLETNAGSPFSRG